MPADRNRGASNPDRTMSDIPSHQIYLSRQFLSERLPKVAAADAARDVLAIARADAAEATAYAAKAIRAIAPLESALRKAEQRHMEAAAGTSSHNNRVAQEARIRKLERELAEARTALTVPNPDRDKIDRARQARDDVLAAIAEAHEAARLASDAAKARKRAVNQAHAEALRVAITPRLRRDVNEHLGILERAGQPWTNETEV